MTAVDLASDVDRFLADLEAAERRHETYRRDYKEISKKQDEQIAQLKHLKYLFKQLASDVKKFEQKRERLSEEDRVLLNNVKPRIKSSMVKIQDMERELPATSNGLYLNVILGSNLNISLLNADDRYRYKQEYENFKAKVTAVILAMFVIAFFLSFRPIDAICNFLLVWYYCTLTIRESILRVNGSKIKGWWMAHHYISCVLCGINLTWTMSNSECYDQIRTTLIGLVIYIGIVQIIQTNYQIGCLRRLHALGQRHQMDITVEGFASWMFKGLTFLLPFLLLCYVFQGYCAYELFKMYFFQGCSDWQVIVLAFIIAFVAILNILTTLMVMIRKFVSVDVQKISHKYREKDSKLED